MRLSEVAKIILAGPPASNAAIDGGWVNMENYAHLTAIVAAGVQSSTGTAPTITVEESTAATGGTARAFNYRRTTVAAGETLGAFASSTGLAASTVNNTFTLVELDARELTAGSHWVRVRLGSSTGILAQMTYVLSSGRYQGNTLPAALT